MKAFIYGSDWIERGERGDKVALYIVLPFVLCIMFFTYGGLQSHPSNFNVDKAGFPKSDQNHFTHKFRKLCVEMFLIGCVASH